MLSVTDKLIVQKRRVRKTRRLHKRVFVKLSQINKRTLGI